MHLAGNGHWEHLMQSSKKASLTAKKASLSFPQHHPWVSIPLCLLAVLALVSGVYGRKGERWKRKRERASPLAPQEGLILRLWPFLLCITKQENDFTINHRKIQIQLEETLKTNAFGFAKKNSNLQLVVSDTWTVQQTHCSRNSKYPRSQWHPAR